MAAFVARLAWPWGDEEVAAVAVLHLDDVAEFAEMRDLFEQNDLHLDTPLSDYWLSV